MKTSIFRFCILFLFLCSYSISYATVWTVSNDAARPAQFTTITAAVNAASLGDTLRIAGSNTEYSVPTLYFKLAFIGEGANNPNGLSTQLSGFTLSRLNSSLGSSGSKFYGIKFSSSVNIDPLFAGSTVVQRILSDFIFERCQFQSSLNYINTSQQKITNVIIRNCVFVSSLVLGQSTQNSNDISGIITNCIFDSGATVISTTTNILNGGVIIRNSLFINSISPRFTQTNGIIIENCIFYKSEPTGAINSVFNNNISYLANNNTLPYGSNAGSGNLINVNPLFINYPALGANFAWTHNYGLQVGSPAIGTGSNGTNIGLSGGNAPVNNIPGNSRIPVVTGLTLPTASVPVGGTLEINIQAISRN